MCLLLFPILLFAVTTACFSTLLSIFTNFKSMYFHTAALQHWCNPGRCDCSREKEHTCRNCCSSEDGNRSICLLMSELAAPMTNAAPEANCHAMCGRVEQQLVQRGRKTCLRSLGHRPLRMPGEQVFLLPTSKRNLKHANDHRPPRQGPL